VNYAMGLLDPWWKYHHRDLPYVHEPFNNAADVDLWRDQGFTNERFTGDMYDMRFAEPWWIREFREVLPMQHFSWSMYRMLPGDIMPRHSDTYARFCQINDIVDVQLVRRYVVFMEPWQSGHVFEIDDHIITDWQAGSWVSWLGDVPHLAANIGSSVRYTLQLTGLDL